MDKLKHQSCMTRGTLEAHSSESNYSNIIVEDLELGYFVCLVVKEIKPEPAPLYELYKKGEGRYTKYYKEEEIPDDFYQWRWKNRQEIIEIAIAFYQDYLQNIQNYFRLEQRISNREYIWRSASWIGKIKLWLLGEKPI